MTKNKRKFSKYRNFFRGSLYKIYFGGNFEIKFEDI
jgi:hypothetical protein